MVPLLRTERLSLRPLEPRDDGQFWRLRTDPVVSQWLDRDVWDSVDKAREQRLKLEAYGAAGKGYFWALAEGSGPLLGTICLWNFNADRSDCELGFELFPSRQGRGLMGESVAAVLEWAGADLALKQVSALTHRDNRAAMVLLERQGFVNGPIPADWEVSEAEAATQLYYHRDLR